MDTPDDHALADRRGTADGEIATERGIRQKSFISTNSRCRPEVIRVSVTVGSRRKHRFAMDSPRPDRPAEMT
jgi:hypothetical protein